MLESLLAWLHRHSTSVVREGAELRFTHPTGSTSILIVRDAWVDGVTPVKNDQLAFFYSEYWAASIGDGHIIIGTPVLGGMEISHGYRVPDLEDMAATSISLGMEMPPDFQIFMMQGSWLFAYGIKDESGPIVRYDFDYKEFDPVSGIEELLNQWWEIKITDADQ